MLSQYECSAEILEKAVRSFPKRKLLVVGDLMLDRFVWGEVSRISPEAPVPVVEIRTETTCLGGAANVSANIRNLGGCPLTLGVLGDDLDGQNLRKEFRAIGAPVSGLVVDRSRATTVKTRIIAHHQQVCRTDREDKDPISARTRERVQRQFGRLLPSVDGVVISDYSKGLISAPFLRHILPLAKTAGKIVCVDPKALDFSAYRPATVITPNTLEAERASGMSISTPDEVERAGRKILRQSGIEHLLVTLGEQGMALFEGKSKMTLIPTVAREVFDVTGAGDTVISTLTLGLVSGLTIREAAILSNIAAGIVVGKLGTASVSREELISRIRE